VALNRLLESVSAWRREGRVRDDISVLDFAGSEVDLLVALKKSTDRAEELQTCLDNRRLLLANASHELRTPISALIQLIDSATAAGSELREFAPQIREISRHVSRMVDILLLADPDRPQDVKNGLIENFDLGAEILATTKLVYNSKALFDVDAASCLGIMVRGDLSALRRILINLLSNAFKFADRGQVHLFASASVDTLENKVRCVISLRDTGPGVDADVERRLFEAFSTGGPKDGQAGTGLGLWISKKLAVELSGDLRLVRSDPSMGCEFECAVAFERVATECECGGGMAAVVSDPLAEAPAPRRRVLLAEDDSISAEALRLLIEFRGHEVVHVDSFGKLGEVLESEHGHFDLALIDDGLPGGRGVEMVRRFRGRIGWSNMKFVLISADNTSEIVEVARELKVDILCKPVAIDTILRLLG
jgi:signal transduction histidine kinase